MAKNAKAKPRRPHGRTKAISPDNRYQPMPEQFLAADPWTKAKYESADQYAMFSLFRDMGPSRQRILVAEDVGVSANLVSKYSVKFRWDERAEAFDAHLDQIKLKEMEREHKQMGQRQAKLGMKLQNLAEVGVDHLITQPDELSARDVAILAETGAKIERAARGEKASSDTTVILNLPLIPAWAASSKFIQCDPNLKPTVEISREEAAQLVSPSTTKMLPPTPPGAGAQ